MAVRRTSNGWCQGSEIILPALLVLLAGCGGGGGSASQPATRGIVALKMTWPSATSTTTRQVPNAANSAVITIQDAKGFQDDRIVERPPTSQNQTVTAEFFGLAEGPASVTASAFTGHGGNGQQVAQAAQTLTLATGKQVTSTIDFAPIVKEIRVAPPQASINQGDTVNLNAAGYTDNGVQTDPTPSGTWSSADTNIATVDQNGKVTGINPGVVAITFTAASNGLTGSSTITVHGGNAEVNLQ
jgi:uncharacterized protein YjdB